VYISARTDQVFQHKQVTTSKSIEELGKKNPTHPILHYAETTLNYRYGPMFEILPVKYNINTRPCFCTSVQVKTWHPEKERFWICSLKVV